MVSVKACRVRTISLGKDTGNLTDSYRYSWCPDFNIK